VPDLPPPASCGEGGMAALSQENKGDGGLYGGRVRRGQRGHLPRQKKPVYSPYKKMLESIPSVK